MRDSDAYREHIVSELKENLEQKPQAFDFDVSEGLKSGTMIIGGRGTGKSNLAKHIVKQLIDNGCIIRIFEVSNAWLSDTPIKNIAEIVPNSVLDIPLNESVTFDLSRLHVKQIKAFVAQIVATEYEIQSNTPKEQRKPKIFVFEDSVISLPKNRLTSIEAEEILRLITVGRNFDLSYIGIVQRPALTDTSLFELSSQKFIGRLDGQNDKKKLRNYIDREYIDMLDSLSIGEFVYKTKKIAIPLFDSSVKPRRLKATENTTEQGNQILGYLLLGLLFVGIAAIITLILR